MRIYNKLDEILSQGSKIKILRFLFLEGDEHTGRGIAKAIGMSPSVTHKALKELEEEGLLAIQKKGNAILYKIRENHYVIKKLLKPLFRKEQALYNDMITVIKNSLLKERDELVSIAIFGSVARGQETAESDVDLLVVTERKGGKSKVSKIIRELEPDMAKEFGAALSPYIVTKAELKRRYAQRQPLLKSILDSNRLIYGEPVERILA